MIDTVLLDRDGVINFERSGYVTNPDQWQPLPGSIEAVALLGATRKVGIATNQRGIALGLYTQDDLAAIHQKMTDLIEFHGGHIDALAYCPHHKHEHCSCRKPEPGMLITLLKQLQSDPASTIMVGDKYTDIQAAQAAGVQPILVLTGYGQSSLEAHPTELADVPIYADLAAVALALEAGTL